MSHHESYQKGERMRLHLMWREPSSPEWEEMWQSLAAEVGNIDEPDPESLESWQYMGSSVDEEGVLHEFRHRSLKGERVHRHIPGHNAGR